MAETIVNDGTATQDPALFDGCAPSIDYLEMVGADKIPGHTSFRIFGERAVLSADATGDDIWEGTLAKIAIPAPTGDYLSFVSSSAEDSSTGTGIRSLFIKYLDVNGVSQSATIATNGLTIVDTGILARFVQYIHGASWGSTNMAQGTISLYKTGVAADQYQVITPGGNRSMSCIAMVPAGKTLKMKAANVSATGGTKPISIRIRATADYEGNVTSGFLYRDPIRIENACVARTYPIALSFPSLSIIKATAFSAQAGGGCSVTLEGWIE